MPGIDLRVQVDGIDALTHRLQRAIAIDTRAEPMQRLAERVRERLQMYPAPPPNSTYVRTGNLGRGWTVSGDARGTNQYADQVSVEMRNPTSYAGFVQGDKRDGSPSQTTQHAETGWATTRQALDAEVGPFMSDLSTSIVRAFGA